MLLRDYTIDINANLAANSLNYLAFCSDQGEGQHFATFAHNQLYRFNLNLAGTKTVMNINEGLCPIITN